MTQRLSVNINDETAAALQDLAQRRNTTVTETVRRAVSVLKFVEDETARGCVIQMTEPPVIEQAVILDRPAGMRCSELEPYDFGSIIPGACLVDIDPSEWKPL